MKAVKPYSKVQLDDEDLLGTSQRANDNIEKSLKGLTNSAIVAGSLIENVVLSTTAKRVPHKLGRSPLGYIVVKRNASSTVYDQQEAREDLFLNLIATADVTVSLWVF